MYPRIPRLEAFTFTAALALAACGGSDPKGPEATNVSYGAIESGGSLVVNGTTFSTPNTSIVVNGAGGQPATELKAGRVARVSGSSSGGTGEAFEVRMDAILEGKVGARTTGPAPFFAEGLDVRGQKISVDDSTLIVDPSGATTTVLPTSGRVSVYGFPDVSGTIRATRIETRPDNSEQIEVRGFVSGLNPTAKTFTLKVISTSATSFAVTLAAAASIPAGMTDGSYVEVRSSAAPATPPPQNGPTIVEATATLEDSRLGTNTEAEIEGVVAGGTSASFTVLGVTVVTSGSTIWENGVPGDLASGVKVEAEGSLDASGVLQARKVSFRSNIRIQGVPTNITATGFDLFDGFFTVHVDEFTDLTGVTLGTNTVEVRGRRHANGGSEVVATRIVDEGIQPRIFLQGPVTSTAPASNTLVILGVTVNATGAQFRDSRPEPEVSFPNASAFFAQVSPGTVVKVRGDTAGSFSAGPPPTLTADEATLEGSR